MAKISIKLFFFNNIFLALTPVLNGKCPLKSEFNEVNYQSLVNLLSFFQSNNKLPRKIIFSSTISVYGEKYYQSIYDEGVVPKPINPYAVSKLKAEKYLIFRGCFYK